MRYKYTLPDTLSDLKKAAEVDEPGVKRLRRLALSKAMFQAVKDWPRFRQTDEIYENDKVMEAAREACKRLLLERIEEGAAVTNSLESFTMLFIQSYYGGYLGVIETAQRGSEEMGALVWLVGDRPEPDAIATLEVVAELATRRPQQHSGGYSELISGHMSRLCCKNTGEHDGVQPRFLLSLGCHSKETGDERDLAHDVPLFHPL